MKMSDQRAMGKARSIGLVAAAFLPAIPAWLLWPIAIDMLGPEGTAGAVFAAQIALALWLPDRLAEWVVRERKRR